MRQFFAFMTLLLGALPAVGWAQVNETAGTPLGRRSWVPSDSYPPTALRAEIGGTAGYRLSYDRDGIVTDCEVIESSGSAILDDAVCPILSIRARFRPARDAGGQPSPGTYADKVTWTMPGVRMSARSMVPPHTIIVAVDVDEKGRIENCFLAGGRRALLVADPCVDYPKGRRAHPIKDEAHPGVRYRMVVTKAVEYHVRPAVVSPSRSN